MFKKTLIATAAAAIALSALTACSSSTKKDALPTVRLMVGGIDKQIYLPYELAQRLGYYKKYGVNVVLSTEQDGGVGAEEAMASGQVDMAGAWYLHTIDFQTKGKQVVDVVQLSGAPGEREMCATNSNIHSAADFTGKTLGVTDLGSGTDTLTKFLAAKANIASDKINRVAVGAGATAIAALKNGSAQCVMTTQPTVTAIQKLGVGYSAVDLASTAGATQAVGGAWPAASVLATKEYVDGHKDAVQRVVNALVDTMHWINTHSAQEIADKLPAAYTSNANLTKDDYVKALDQDKGQFLPDGIMPAGGPKTVLAMEQLIGLSGVDKVDLAATFDNSFAINANKTEGYQTTTTPAGSDG